MLPTLYALRGMVDPGMSTDEDGTVGQLSRGAATRAVDRVLLAELRDCEALRATEEGRAGISREIHDDSLQALVAWTHDHPAGDRGGSPGRRQQPALRVP